MRSYTAEIPFKFEIPIESFYKAGSKGKERRIGGIVSTESKDRQGETIIQDGLDFSSFLAAGWFNDNHSKETTGIVGYPTKVERTTHNGRPAHYVEGYLLDNYDRADEIWKLANALQKTGRRLGFSVEGSILRRENNGEIVAKAQVRNVAITNCPVNTESGLEVLAKSLQAVQAAAPAYEEWLRRGLAAGSAISDPGVSAGEGFPLRAESLERAPKRKRKRKLKMAEAVQLLKSRYRGISADEAARIIHYTLNHAR